MKVEPSYVTLEQAKLLKELGFDVEVDSAFDIKTGIYLDNNFKKYQNFNSILHYPNQLLVSRPEHWQVVEWLRVVKGIQLFLDYRYYTSFNYGFKFVKPNGDYEDRWFNKDIQEADGSLSYNKAYSAAFDYILPKLKMEK